MHKKCAYAQKSMLLIIPDLPIFSATLVYLCNFFLSTHHTFTSLNISKLWNKSYATHISCSPDSQDYWMVPMCFQTRDNSSISTDIPSFRSWFSCRPLSPRHTLPLPLPLVLLPMIQHTIYEARTSERAIQYNAIQYKRIRNNTIQYNTIQYNTIQYNAIQCNAMQCYAIQLYYTILGPPSKSFQGVSSSLHV